MKSLPIPESLKPGNLVPDWTPGKVFKVTFALVLLFLLAVISGKLFEQVNADEIVVIQSPIAGTLSWYTTPGLKWQGWGTVTRYRKSFTHWFSYRPEQGARHDQSIKTRFYDGGHAKISGSVRVDLPLDEKSLTALHIRFGSQDAIEHAVVGTVFEKAVYMAGPLMSSKESYAEKRPLLIFYIEDHHLLPISSPGTFMSLPENLLQPSAQKSLQPAKLTASPMTRQKAKQFPRRM